MFNSLATVAFSKKTFHFRTPCITNRYGTLWKFWLFGTLLNKLDHPNEKSNTGFECIDNGIPSHCPFRKRERPSTVETDLIFCVLLQSQIMRYYYNRVGNQISTYRLQVAVFLSIPYFMKYFLGESAKHFLKICFIRFLKNV